MLADIGKVEPLVRVKQRNHSVGVCPGQRVHCDLPERVLAPRVREPL